MQLDERECTPGLLARLVRLVGTLPSFALAAAALGVARDTVRLSGRQVQRLTQPVGAELVAEQDRQAEAYRRRELSPAVATAPAVAVVEVDGGRLRTRRAGAGPGVHDPATKEDKVACLVSMQSQEHPVDPQPEPPAGFADARRVQRLVAQVQRSAGPPAADPDDPATRQNRPRRASGARRHARAGRTAEADAAVWWPGRPTPLVRTCVARVCSSRQFGPLAAAAAHRRRFFDAPRQAFVGDGAAYNWRLQRAYFPHFVPIVDFIHVLCSVYRAAQAAEPSDEAAGWRRFERWLRDCWQGRVGAVITELADGVAAATATADLGRPPPVEASAMTEALRYLRNNRSRMDYPRYRRSGLPVTSSLVESLVGDVNARVKARNKAWDRPAGANAILAVRAAVLSEDGGLERFMAQRQGGPYRRRTTAAAG